MNRILTILLPLWLVAAPVSALAQGESQAQGKQPGDDALSCAELGAELEKQQGELAVLSSETEKPARAQMNGMVAKQQAGGVAKSILSGLGGLVPGGGLVSAGLGALAKAPSRPKDPAADMMEKLQPVIDRQVIVAERMEHLEGLYTDKCLVEAEANAERDTVGKPVPDR